MTMHPLRQVLVASFVVLGCLVPAGAAGEKLEVAVTGDGLSRLAWAGTDLLKDGKPQVTRVVLEHATLDANSIYQYTWDRLGGEGAKVSYDAGAKRLSYAYPWGSVQFAYRPAGDRLGMTVTIRNDSKTPIADFEIRPLVLHFPNPPTKPEKARWIETMPDGLGVVEANFGPAKVLACCETVLPLKFGLSPSGKQDSSVMLSGGVPMMEPAGVVYPLLGLPRVEPGKSLTISFSLRFSAAPAARRWVIEPVNRELLADVYDAYRKYHQPRLSWPDHRPIGTIFVGKGHGPEANPRNWFGLKDVQSPEGKAELRKRFLAYADQCIAVLKKNNAQGMVLWDPEGGENPHPITYIGDPRMVPLIAPEMADIYPEFFKKFRDAGLRTGCCLRPTQTYLTEPNNLCDGDLDTGWAVLGFPQWAELDLGADRRIARTELVCFKDRAYQYKIEARTADGEYRQIADGTDSNTPAAAKAPVTDKYDSLTARYVKLTITAPPQADLQWCNVVEFRVLDPAGRNLALKKIHANSSPHSRMANHGTGSHDPANNPLGDNFDALRPKGISASRFYPVVERLCRKIDYARKNWGCTIFYVDTNGVQRPTGEKQELKWTLLDSHVWREVIRRNPDVLLIPELGTGTPGQYAYAAQYLQPPYSGGQTPAYVRELLPGAWSVCQSVNLSPADWNKRRPELLDGIRHGDSMFFRSWFNDSFNGLIKAMYDEVYQPDAIAPPPLKDE